MKFEDNVLDYSNHLLVLNKPAGLTTQGDGGLEELGREWVAHRFGKPGTAFLHAVHRLDRPASGVLLFARTSKALSRMQAHLREGRFEKTYVALVQGHMKEEAGEWEDHLVHGAFQAHVDPSGRPARLKFRVLNVRENYTLVAVALMTGRYHQIRVQFASRGYPIVGDYKYGSHTTFAPSGAIALHHFALKVPHPTSGEDLCFVAPCPFAAIDSARGSSATCLSHLSARPVSHDHGQRAWSENSL